MGFFDSFSKIHYRSVAIQAKDYAIDHALTEEEKSWVSHLHVKTHEYIAERDILRIGLIRSTFEYADRQLKKQEIQLALSLYLRNLDEYFTTFTTLSNLQAHELIYRYGIAEPEDLCKVFFDQVTRGRLDGITAIETDGAIQLMEWYLKNCLQFTMDKVSKLQPC